MAAHITDCGKVVQFGTLIDDSVNSNYTKFGVSNSNSLAPPLVQKFNFVMLITRGVTRSRVTRSREIKTRRDFSSR